MATSAPAKSITDQLFDGEVTKSLKFASQCFGVSLSHSYALARAGEYPVDVLKLGSKYRVRTQDLIQVLGIVAPV